MSYHNLNKNDGHSGDVLFPSTINIHEEKVETMNQTNEKKQQEQEGLGVVILPPDISLLLHSYMEEKGVECFDLIVKDVSFPILVSVGHLIQCNIITNTVYNLKVGNRITIKRFSIDKRLPEQFRNVFAIMEITELSNLAALEYAKNKFVKLLDMTETLELLEQKVSIDPLSFDK